MYLEKRPTCVTVIGWAWIIIGVLLCLRATTIITFMIIDILQDDHEIGFIPKIFLMLMPVVIAFGVLGLISGINFLKFKSWARNVLGVLSWLALFFIASFGILWFSHWPLFTPSALLYNKLQAQQIAAYVMGAGSFLIYAIPFGIMIKYLRTDKVKNAMEKSENSEIEKPHANKAIANHDSHLDRSGEIC